MEKVIVVAPHADDETLGCAGALLKLKDQGAQTYWLLVTRIDTADGLDPTYVNKRNAAIEEVTRQLRFDRVFRLNLALSALERYPLASLVDQIGTIFREIEPTQVLLPYPGDIHTDHRVVFDATAACTKWFRYPSVRRVLAYETLSETEFGLNPDLNGFRPNVFVDISSYIETKIAILECYSTEVGPFPFPRSSDAVRGLAAYRGSTSGCTAAEAFMLLREFS